MSATAWKWIGGTVAALGVATVWASVGPDSVYQNNFVDPKEAAKAEARLEPLFPGQELKPGMDYAILIEGIHPGGVSDGDVGQSRMEWIQFQQGFQDLDPNFLSRHYVWVLVYKTERSDREIAIDLHRLWEGNPALTQARGKAYLLAHSRGGKIAHEFMRLYGERKVRIATGLNCPMFGADFADEAVLHRGFIATYGRVVGEKLFELTRKNSPFDPKSPGIQGLRYRCAEIMERHRAHPLSAKWRLYVSTITPPRKGLASNVQAAYLAAEIFAFKRNPSNLNDELSYRQSALVIQCIQEVQGRTVEPSDGMVTKDSMSGRCPGIPCYAKVWEVPEEYNHSEIKDGKADYTIVRRVMEDWGWLGPAPLPAANNLPTAPMVPHVDLGTLSESRVLTGMKGEVYIGKALNAEPRLLTFYHGECEWATWWGDSVILSLRSGSGTDLFVADVATQRIKPLTHDGVSRLGAVMDGVLVYFRSGCVCMQSPVGSKPHDLGKGVVSSKNPPVLLGGFVYYLDGDTLYRIPKAGGEPEAAGTNVVGIRRVGDCLLVHQQVGSEVITRVVGGTPDANLNASLDQVRLYHANAEAVDRDSVTGQVYILRKGYLRYLDQEAWGRFKAAGVTPTLSEIFPDLGTADFMDIK